MLEELTEVLEEIVNDANFIPSITKVMKRLYDELLEVGFTEEQASSIVANYKFTN